MASEEGLTGLLDKGKHQKSGGSSSITEDDSIGFYPSWNKIDNSFTRDELLDLDSEGLNLS